MKNYKLISVILSILFLVVTYNIFIVYPAIAKDRNTVLKIVTPYPPGNEATVTAEKFVELVEKYSKGKITAQLLSNGEGGNETQIVEGINAGTVDISTTGMLPVTQYATKYSFLNCPFVIEDYNHFKRVWASIVGDKTKEVLLQNNIRVMGFYYRGTREITSNKPIYTADDLKGLKLRIPQNKIWEKFYSEYEAIPVIVQLPDLYNALKDGIAEASEGPASQLASYKLNEVQKYLNMSDHQLSVGLMCISESTFEGLKKCEQKIVEKAAVDALKYGDNYALSSEQECVNTLLNNGMIQINTDKESFKSKAQKVIEDLFTTEWTEISLDEFLNI